jgi:mono/diheme cytochrome c family protein
MVIQRLEVFMRTRIIVHAALLSLGLALPAWASPRILPPPPAPDMEMPLKNESRQKPVMPPAPPRGQMLYENHCMSCHESLVHIRGNHRAHSPEDIRGWVSHWATYLHLRWGQEEVEEVVKHLNDQYYKFEPR